MPVTTLQKQDIWYAKALLPILNHEKCVKLELICGQRASYLINDDRLLALKKGRTWKQKKGKAWNFFFLSPLKEFLVQKAAATKKVFLLLVCGNEVVCAIKWSNGFRLMGGDAGGRQSWLRVTCKNGKYYVTGPNKIGETISPARYTRSDFVSYILS
ncbi:MAG: hypothetical protein Q8N04_09175 [Nitrospira sp.]|nr:hypothetical protein [Nitrospira sp.]